MVILSMGAACCRLAQAVCSQKSGRQGGFPWRPFAGAVPTRQKPHWPVSFVAAPMSASDPLGNLRNLDNNSNSNSNNNQGANQKKKQTKQNISLGTSLVRI